MLTIERVIAAVQRTSHLRYWDMRREHAVLYGILCEVKEEREIWQLRKILHNAVGRCLITDVRFVPKHPLDAS